MSNAFDEAQRKIKELEALRSSLGDAAVDAAIATIKAQIGGISGTATVGGANYGQNVGVNTGTISHNSQNINNNAPNQGAQGTFGGPVSFNHGGTTFNQQGQNVGTQHNAGRDMNIQNQQAGGNITGSPQISGSGNSYVGGDSVSGDKISGDISVGGGVGGTGIAIGHKPQAQVQQGNSASDLAQAFAQVYAAIAASQHPAAIQTVVQEQVQKIETEAQKGEAADANQIEGWLTVIARMAPDILEVTANTLLNPVAGVATVIKKVAEKAKQQPG